jgi:16S rRNA (guanine966-N2)-methyltransferase
MAAAFMRIIAGTAKGRRINGPRGPLTRPMTDRAKEAIFSSLGPVVHDAAVLDLYAGSGSLGLEALSRGADTAVFVEWRRAATQVLRSNIELVALGGEVVPAKVEEYLSHGVGAFDLVFVDPPYDLPLPSVMAVLDQLVRWLSEDATVIVHRRAGSGEVSGIDGLAVVDQRRYGDAEITRLVREAQA